MLSMSQLVLPASVCTAPAFAAAAAAACYRICSQLLCAFPATAAAAAAE
jgi:hypothetical protein